MEKRQKELVENCVTLQISRFPEGAPRETCFTLNGHDRTLEVRYELSQNDILTIVFDGKEQCLEIQKIPAFMGVKTFFVCVCGKRCKNLYLRPAGERFACRVCNNLVYVSTRICKDTVNGVVLRDFSRLIRFIERREAMQSIFYKGQPTKKFSRLLDDAERFGFKGFADEQRNGFEEIKLMREVVNFAKSDNSRI